MSCAVDGVCSRARASLRPRGAKFQSRSILWCPVPLSTVDSMSKRKGSWCWGIKHMRHTKKIVCAYCKGRGKPQGSSFLCLVCEARGTVVVEGPTKPCPSCQGAGRRRGEILACFTCRGKGVIEPKRKHAVPVVPPARKLKKAAPSRLKAPRKKPVKPRRASSAGGGVSERPRQKVKPVAVPAPKNEPEKKPEPEKVAKKVAKQESLWQKVKNLLK